MATLLSINFKKSMVKKLKQRNDKSIFFGFLVGAPILNTPHSRAPHAHDPHHRWTNALRSQLATR
jgi:hypothetical protein